MPQNARQGPLRLPGGPPDATYILYLVVNGPERHKISNVFYNNQYLLLLLLSIAYSALEF